MTVNTKLMDMYIRDTMNDGQKFCGCRSEECSDFNKKTACRECLKKYVNEKIENNTEEI